jgi:hypothetical protein
VDSEVTRLDAPIDLMFLIHKALSAEARRVQEMVEDVEDGGSLQPFRSAFSLWASHLMYHADIEDEHMTALLTTF